MTSGVRDLTRDAVRTQLAEAAYDCFLARGFERTTVEDAARAAGVSRATFFRYFRSKEDAVIVAMESAALDFGTRLRTLDVRDGRPVWQHLRTAFEPAVESTDAAPERVRAKARMISSVPSLAAHLAERRRAQETLLSDALAEQVQDPLTAKVLVATALAAFDLAWREWAASTASFREVLDDVFARLDVTPHP
ncbi:TetR family transcriptional regulator [Sanguibacter sp. 25GB23B1]|uniref:TetR family transcriptional regulator n=1 Tax=unclassified Sanguibacter TaxID=2645534 RepID=UPI0032AED398